MATSHFGRGELQAQGGRSSSPTRTTRTWARTSWWPSPAPSGCRRTTAWGDLERLKLLLANGVPVVAEMWFTPAPTTAWATTACWWATTTIGASSPTTATTSRGSTCPPVRPLRRRLARVQPHLHPRLHGGGGPHRGRDPGPGRGRRGDVGAHPGNRPAGGAARTGATPSPGLMWARRCGPGPDGGGGGGLRPGALRLPGGCCGTSSRPWRPIWWPGA